MPDKETDPKPIRDGRGQFLPGPGTAGPGRPKGTPNAITMTLRDGIEEAYHQLGGVAWLVRLGQEEPRVFASLLSKLLPPTAPEGDGEMVIRIIGGFTSEPDDD
ncbi:MAG: hypothetical protein GJU72_14475 [Acidithiobacillus ferriphilus]|uniref:hypothetical protein n=1 Tax=Acidithiobacillus ferriphilus TaxID=1689834 RepID=UPI002430958A|nr:hypothetical protein [Acidithiobacillus ferriphilus]MBW9250226.1 hypothetical protein [Acidithiobacillus ferriphilus]MBW9255334.1 hypothetical protein [Acidithiobacillus ferriphilus]